MKPRAFALSAWLPSAPLWLVAALSAGGAPACANAQSTEERQLDGMRAEIDRIASSRDEVDQMGLGAPEADEPPGRPPGAPPPSEPPPPRASTQAMTLGGDEPSSDDDYADTEDTTPRPVIRVLGSPRSSRRGWQGDDPAGAGDDTPPALDPAAKRAYDAALALVAAKRYLQALDALAAFLVKWPDHPYAGNAMYWRGESYFAEGQYVQAAEQLEGVVARFPGGNKVPDALLKLGLCARKQGDEPKAKGYFDRLAQEYPQSEAARRIPPAPAEANPTRGPAPEAPPR